MPLLLTGFARGQNFVVATEIRASVAYGLGNGDQNSMLATGVSASIPAGFCSNECPFNVSEDFFTNFA